MDINNNQFFGNKIVISKLIDDLISLSKTNLPEIDIIDAFIAIDILENINDGEIYNGMFFALAMAAKYFRFECNQNKHYTEKQYYNALIKEIKPVLTNVKGADYLGQFLILLYESLGEISLYINTTLENIYNVANTYESTLRYYYNIRQAEKQLVINTKKYCIQNSDNYDEGRYELEAIAEENGYNSIEEYEREMQYIYDEENEINYGSF